MKKKIKKGIIVIIILVCAFLYAHIDKLTYFYEKDTQDFVNIGNLTDANISQNFICEENILDGIQAKCSITGQIESVQIKYSLIDEETNKEVAQGSVLGSEIKNNKFNRFEFPQQIKGCKGKQYRIVFEEIGSDELNGVSFYIVQEAKKDMKLTVKGSEIDGVMAARTISHRFDVETFGVLIIFVIYITIFMKLLYKLFK